jgi:hypothetical protein
LEPASGQWFRASHPKHPAINSDSRLLVVVFFHYAQIRRDAGFNGRDARSTILKKRLGSRRRILFDTLSRRFPMTFPRNNSTFPAWAGHR